MNVRHAPVTLVTMLGVLLPWPSAPVAAQSAVPAKADPAPRRPPWYETLSLRGYTQVRYNRLLETNRELRCDQCDRSWGRDGGLFIRRARFVISGQVHPRVLVYFQPDFATTVGTSQLVATVRDWYVDVGLDDTNTWRVRLGQSKVPYSFEALQSSSQRLPLDRADATNSAHINERDLGAFVLWAPKRIRDRFRFLVDSGYKGSGDFGALALGVYNGQGANRPEANDGLHAVARATWPFRLGARNFLEPSIAAFTGRYVLTSDLRSTGIRGRPDWEYRDARVLASLAWQGRPVGVLAEYNVGRGPQYDPATDSVRTSALSGGFVTVNGWIARKGQQYRPYARWQVYDGAKRHERDARYYRVRDVELGLEWQPSRAIEFVAQYQFGDRTMADRTERLARERGRVLRLQVQVNY